MTDPAERGMRRIVDAGRNDFGSVATALLIFASYKECTLEVAAEQSMIYAGPPHVVMSPADKATVRALGWEPRNTWHGPGWKLKVF